MDRYCSDLEELRDRFPTNFSPIGRYGDHVLRVASEDTYMVTDYVGRANVDSLMEDYAHLVKLYDGPYFRLAYVDLEDLENENNCEDISRVLYTLEEFPVWDDERYYLSLPENMEEE